MKNYLTTIKIKPLLFIGLLAIMGLVNAADKELPKEVEGMLLNKDAKVDISYIKPGVDWKKFKTFYLRTLNVTDEAKDASPKNKVRGPGHARESWIIPEKDIELMKTEFTRIIKESLEKEGMKIVAEISADTLIIVPTITDIYLNAPIEESRDTFASRGGVYTKGAGSMTLAATFADGSDMSVIAYAVDNKYPSSMWSKNTRLRNISEMKRLFYSWGRMISKSLNKLNK